MGRREENDENSAGDLSCIIASLALALACSLSLTRLSLALALRPPRTLLTQHARLAEKLTKLLASRSTAATLARPHMPEIATQASLPTLSASVGFGASTADVDPFPAAAADGPARHASVQCALPLLSLDCGGPVGPYAARAPCGWLAAKVKIPEGVPTGAPDDVPDGVPVVDGCL